MSYLHPIDSTGIIPNCFSRLSSDIVRLICEHLGPIDDIVAFARTCKFTYRAIAPLFTIRLNGTDQWEGFCLSITGNIESIVVTRIRGARARLTGDLGPFYQEYRHLNDFKKLLMKASTVSTEQQFIRPDRQWGRFVFEIDRRDIGYVIKEIQKITTMSNRCAYKRRKLTQ